MLRVVVAVVLGGSASVAAADHWAELPPEARVAPLGVGFLLPYLPITPGLVRAARVVLHLACVTGGLGLQSRASFAIATLAASYVLLVPQLGGAGGNPDRG